MLRCLLFFTFAALCPPIIQAQQSAATPKSLAVPPLSRPAKEWAEDAAQNELRDLQESAGYLRYRSRIVNAHGDQTRDLIQSQDGTVARLILRDGKPLQPEQDAAERSRLDAMLQSPEAFARHIKGEESGRKNGVEILRQVPQAMLWMYADGQPQRPGVPFSADAKEIVLDFAPDPKWTPASLLSGALTGIHGRVWIDPQTKHLSRLEAQVFKPINVGFGLLGKVFPGGTVRLDEVYGGDTRWIYSSFSEHITLRALMVKTIREDSEVSAYQFTRVARMPYQEAIHTLLAAPRP